MASGTKIILEESIPEKKGRERSEKQNPYTISNLLRVENSLVNGCGPEPPRVLEGAALGAAQKALGKAQRAPNFSNPPRRAMLVTLVSNGANASAFCVRTVSWCVAPVSVACFRRAWFQFMLEPVLLGVATSLRARVCRMRTKHVLCTTRNTSTRTSTERRPALRLP